ncbi:hypothetical protein Y600_3265 [Burkholderia pseudomallei MSHR3709]|nr:hypothetical protein Y600_3265 [Burkholderia pseudomallei MSHR3709]
MVVEVCRQRCKTSGTELLLTKVAMCLSIRMKVQTAFNPRGNFRLVDKRLNCACHDGRRKLSRHSASQAGQVYLTKLRHFQSG